MLTVGGVIDAARDRHSAFDRRRTPDGVLLRHLSAYVKHLHGRIAAVDPDVLHAEQVTALPLADHAAGITLPANRTVAAVAVGDKSTPQRSFDIDLIPAKSKNDFNAPVYAAWQLGNKLYLRSPASLWTQGKDIAIAYVAIPVSFTKLEDDITTLPDTAEMALIESIALLLARRGHADPALPDIDVKEQIRIAADAEESFVKDIANRKVGRRFRTRDVWRPGGMGVAGGERRWSP